MVDERRSRRGEEGGGRVDRGEGRRGEEEYGGLRRTAMEEERKRGGAGE